MSSGWCTPSDGEQSRCGYGRPDQEASLMGQCQGEEGGLKEEGRFRDFWLT